MKKLIFLMFTALLCSQNTPHPTFAGKRVRSVKEVRGEATIEGQSGCRILAIQTGRDTVVGLLRLNNVDVYAVRFINGEIRWYDGQIAAETACPAK